MSFALSELAQRNYLKAVREKAWQDSSVYRPLARYVVRAAMRISGPIRRVVPRSKSVPLRGDEEDLPPPYPAPVTSGPRTRISLGPGSRSGLRIESKSS